MSHAMCSTLQSQNVLVELTHKHTHTHMPWALTDPSSIWWTSTHCHHSHSVKRCNPMAIPSAGLHGSDYWNSIRHLKRNNSKKMLSSGMASIRTQASRLKGSPPKQTATFKPAGVQSSLTVPASAGLNLGQLALSHFLRPPNLRWFTHRQMTTQPHRTCLNI